MEDGRKGQRKPTERSSPRRMFPERSRWTRVVAVKGLALSDWERLFTPATVTRQTLVSIPGTKMSSVIFFKGPTAPSTCRTEVNQKHHSQKAARGWSSDIFSRRTVSQSQTTNSLRRMKWNQLHSAPLLLVWRKILLWNLKWCKQSNWSFYPFLNPARWFLA